MRRSSGVFSYMKRIEIVITGDQGAGKSTVAALMGHLIKHVHPKARIMVIHEGEEDLERLIQMFAQCSVSHTEPVEITIIDDNRARNSPSLNYIRGLSKHALKYVHTTFCRTPSHKLRTWLREHSPIIGPSNH